MPDDAPSPGVREAWGRYASSFASEGTGASDRPSLRRLLELTDPAPGALVLDVATGAGFTGFAFAAAGCRVVALDPTHEMLLATRSGWTEAGFDGTARVVESWAETIPFRDATFDAVVAHRAPHQFADQQAYVAEAARVLRPGGVFGLADQSPVDGFEEWHNTVERERDPTHEHARSSREWRAFTEAAGLKIVAEDRVYQEHDMEDWLGRVDCPPGRAANVRRIFDEIPDEIRDAYRPTTDDGRRRFRTPQCVLVAMRPDDRPSTPLPGK